VSEKLHNEKFYNLYTALPIIRAITSRRTLWAGHIAHMEDVKCIKIVKKTEMKRQFGTLRHKQENSINNRS
jgi:hypothetical protein